MDHISLGVHEAAKDPHAMLLFSGGQTRRAAGPRSEALSYWVGSHTWRTRGGVSMGC